MSTKTYAAIRLLNHLLVILQLLTCISLILLRLYFSDYFSIEEILRIGGLNFKTVVILTSFVNLIVPFFAACAIDSKLRLYMKIFLVYELVVVMTNGMTLMYVSCMYEKIFEKEFSKAITQNEGNRMYIQNTYNCSDAAENTCIRVFTLMLEDIMRYFKGIMIVGIVLNVMMWVLVKISLGLDLKKRSVKVPRIKKEKVGFSTGSLRHKRLVDVRNDSPTGSVLNERVSGE